LEIDGNNVRRRNRLGRSEIFTGPRRLTDLFRHLRQHHAKARELHGKLDPLLRCIGPEGWEPEIVHAAELATDEHCAYFINLRQVVRFCSNLWKLLTWPAAEFAMTRASPARTTFLINCCDRSPYSALAERDDDLTRGPASAQPQSA
jgi:hypothetical protein